MEVSRQTFNEVMVPNYQPAEIIPVRGLGLLLGAPMSAAWKGKAKEIVNAGLKHGVWTLVAGPDVLRLAPALNITEAEVVEGLKRLDVACAELVAGARQA